ncbi:hypothetical protein KKE75_00025 [Patescibacteria group bacterium]|nr:hypothetical protein [Patescibacteria group bacterium]
MVIIHDECRIHHKSGKKNLQGKPVRETEIYVDNKKQGMQARYDVARIGNITKVFQSVWKNVDGVLKIVHNHWKN